MAFLWPTFGKRPTDQPGKQGKRVATMGPATEQTAKTTTDQPAEPTPSSSTCDVATEHIMLAGSPDPELATEHATPSASHDPESDGYSTQRSLPTVALDSLEEILSKFAAHETDDGDIREVRSAAQTLLTGDQATIRKMCVPWSVRRNEKKASGKYGNRTDADIKGELKESVLKRANEFLRTKSGKYDKTVTAGAATERADIGFSLESAMADVVRSFAAVTEIGRAHV